MTFRRRTTVVRLVAAAALGLAAIVFSTTHGDVGWDGMWLLQVIARVRAGEVLYRDVFFGVPPLAVYLGVLVTQVFGVELFALRLLLAAVLVASYLVAADLLARLAGTRRYEAALAPMMFALALPANVPLYQSLANLFLLLAVNASVRWATHARDASGRAAAWLFLAGGAAGLSFAAKPTVGLLALAAVAAVSVFTRSAVRGPLAVRGENPVACLTAGLGFSAGIAAFWIPVALSGGWGNFLDYVFFNKSTYLRVAGVGYAGGLLSFLGRLATGRALGPIAAIKDAPLLLPPLVAVSMAVAWRARRNATVVVTAVLVLAAVELATLFPRSDIDHVVPAVPGFLVAILYGWHVFVRPTTADDLGTEARLAASPWPRRCGAVVMSLVVALGAIRLSASGAALISSERTWSSLPHLAHVRIAKRREAALASHATAIRDASYNGQLFLLVPNAGLYYLVSGVRNPTPFDYPLATAFGRDGQALLALGVEFGLIGRACMATVVGSLAPERLQQAVRNRLRPVADLGPCTLWLSRTSAPDGRPGAESLEPPAFQRIRSRLLPPPAIRSTPSATSRTASMVPLAASFARFTTVSLMLPMRPSSANVEGIAMPTAMPMPSVAAPATSGRSRTKSPT